MFLLGLLLGFVGAGGSGFIIAVLVTFFHVPIYEAIGTAVSVMCLTVLAGSWSHFKEGNLHVKQGLFIGVFGALAAYAGTFLAKVIPSDILIATTITILISSATMLWFKTRVTSKHTEQLHTGLFPLRAATIGLGNGLITGTFGIGGAPFIQLSILKLLGHSINSTVGTTMLILIPISLSASLGFIQNGFFDALLFFKVVLGTMIGSYLGAKLTKKLPVQMLRYGMVLTPVVSAILMMRNLF